MALALESAGKVRQKSLAYVRNPLISNTLKGFFSWWATNKGNADLQLVIYTALDADQGATRVGTENAAGYDTGVDAACTLYAFYGKKTATAEDAFTYVFDDATNDSTTTDATCMLTFLGANGTSTTLPQDEGIMVYSNGVPLVAGVVVKSYTQAQGTTDTAAGSGANGFVIIGGA